MKGFIYIIKNTINNKVYIGQTRVSVLSRWKDHLRHAGYGEQVINRAMGKYGKENFYVETLEECTIEDLDAREIYYISQFDSTNKEKGYNVSIGGLTPKKYPPKIDVKKVVELYKDCFLSVQAIAEQLNTSIYYIKTVLTQNNVKLRDRHDSVNKIKRINKDILEKALLEASSLRSAAKLLKMPYPSFRKACIYHNIEYNSPTSVRH